MHNYPKKNNRIRKKKFLNFKVPAGKEDDLRNFFKKSQMVCYSRDNFWSIVLFDQIEKKNSLHPNVQHSYSLKL